ncbi:MAG: LOG family protein [Deltaproteobacteria bacterium]|nr:LOG family protein [Deltaproteobacteria bacterium]
MAQRTRRRYELREPKLDQMLENLVEEAENLYAGSDSAEYVRQIMVSALGLMRDGASRGDLKLINSALKELRHSFRVFAPYRHLRKVAIFGSARTAPDHPDWKQAYDFAERMAVEGWMTITGAGDGIMGAAQGGAGREASFGVNIRLPFEQSANEVIAGDHKLISFRYFFTRKITFVKEAHAIALFPGGFGTHDEGFEALTLIQTGKSEILPIVFVDAPGGTYWKAWNEYVASHLSARGLINEQDLALYKITDDVDEAVREIQNFYSNYHSSRYVGDLLVLRVRQAPNADQLDELNTRFGDILSKGKIEIAKALPSEAGEVEHYARVTLHFNRRNVGRLRTLIDRINSFVAEPAAPPLDASPHEIVEEPFSLAAETAQEG